MKIDASTQLVSLMIAAFAGLGAGVVYDLLRAVRLRRRKNHALTHVADGIFSVFSGVLCLYLALRVGDGELRLYLLLGLISGVLLWFSLCSSHLRPVWDWWLDTLRQFLRLLWRPVLLLRSVTQKMGRKAKKVFLFCRKRIIMKAHRWKVLWIRSGRKEVSPVAKKKKRRSHSVALLVVLLLIVFLLVQLVQVYLKYKTMKDQTASLTQQEEMLQQSNEALKSDLARKDDPLFWEELARHVADMVKKGERIFLDPNY